MMSNLSHLDNRGRAKMVDVSEKPVTERIAIASGEIVMKLKTLDLVRQSKLIKGDVLSVAKIAGIMAAKQTANIIPLCHPLPITYVDVNFLFDQELPGIIIQSTVRSNGKTGVEMEALMAVSISALTIYDMAKAVEKTMKIQNIRLTEKHGGQSGDVINE